MWSFIFVCTLDILFLSNYNINKSSCGLCFWALDPLIDKILVKSIIKRGWGPKTMPTGTFINVVIWRKSISMQHQWWWSWDRYSIMWWYITHIIPYGFFLTFMKKNEKFSKFWDFDSFLFFKTWGSIAPPGSALCMPCSYVPLVLTQSNLRFSKPRTLRTLKKKSNF